MSSAATEGTSLSGLVVVQEEEEEQACYLTYNSHPVVFHKIEGEEDGDENQGTTTVVTVEYLDHVGLTVDEEDPSASIQFDDEHARAVANLLEFHNQQTNFSSLALADGEDDVGVISSGVEEFSESSDMFLENSVPQELCPAPVVVTHLPTEGQHPRSCRKTYGKIKSVGSDVSAKSVSSSEEHRKLTRVGLPLDVDVPAPGFLPSGTIIVENAAICPKRKRRTIIDTQKVIPIQEFKRQLTDTSDIVSHSMECAPPTKKAMNYLAYGGVGKYFAYSGRRSLSVPLAKLFFSRLNLTSELRPNGSTSVAGSTENPISPLNAELKTPVDVTGESETRRNTILPCQFNDAMAKRAANSFDSFCKGMTKPSKLEFSVRKIKPRGAEVSKLSPRLVNGRHPEVHSSNQSRILFVSSLPSTSEEVTTLTIQQDPNNAFAEQHSIPNQPHHIIYSIEDGNPEQIIKSEIESAQSEDPHLEINGSAPYGPNGPSNFEMLIAAAEQHTNLPSPNTSNASIDSAAIIHTKTEITEEEVTDQIEDVQYNNISEVDQLIVLGGNGERYRIHQDARGDLTFWPTDYDTNIFA